MEEILTIFYNKRTKRVKLFCSGKQTLDVYGDEKEDYEGIIDFIYVPYDPFITANKDYYKVENGKLILDREEVE